MRVVFLLILVSILLPWPIGSQAVVRRCIAADGSTIYTDKRCEQLDAHNAIAPDQVPDTEPHDDFHSSNAQQEERPLSSYGLASQDCARSPDMLLFTVQQALEHRDINGLAGLYHWPGMGKWSARAVMDRLESLVAHSDGSAYLIFPEAAFVVLNPQAWPDLPPEDPTSIRFPMFHANNDDSSPFATLELHIVRHTGCWWLHF